MCCGVRIGGCGGRAAAKSLKESPQKAAAAPAEHQPK